MLGYQPRAMHFWHRHGVWCRKTPSQNLQLDNTKDIPSNFIYFLCQIMKRMHHANITFLSRCYTSVLPHCADTYIMGIRHALTCNCRASRTNKFSACAKSQSSLLYYYSKTNRSLMQISCCCYCLRPATSYCRLHTTQPIPLQQDPCFKPGS